MYEQIDMTPEEVERRRRVYLESKRKWKEDGMPITTTKKYICDECEEEIILYGNMPIELIKGTRAKELLTIGTTFTEGVRMEWENPKEYIFCSRSCFLIFANKLINRIEKNNSAVFTHATVPQEEKND